MKTAKVVFCIALLVFMSTICFAKDLDQSTKNHQRIAQRFIYILNAQWGIDTQKISGESRFKKDFGADSLDITELVMALEEDFDIEILDEEWERITTVNSAVELIADKEDRRY
jgi:acyl carrier protein